MSVPKIDKYELYRMGPAEQHELLLTYLEMQSDTATYVKDQLSELRNLASNVAMPWHRSLEPIIAHLELDVKFLAAAIHTARENTQWPTDESFLTGSKVIENLQPETRPLPSSTFGSE